MSNVLMDKVLRPEEYIYCACGEIATLPKQHTLIQDIHNILIKRGLEDSEDCSVWDFPLSEIDEIGKSRGVILVNVSRIDVVGQYIDEYRWFEAPNGTEEAFNNVNIAAYRESLI